MQRPLLTLTEVVYEFQLGEDFVAKWASKGAEDDFRDGRSKIPAMPVVRPGQRGALYPRHLLMEWLLKYFGHGYTGKEDAA